LMILTIKYPEMQKFTTAIIRFMRRYPVLPGSLRQNKFSCSPYPMP
jgi:hypothetical protein